MRVIAGGASKLSVFFDEMHLKFTDCARHTQRIDAAKAQQAFEAIQKHDDLDDIRTLVDFVR